MRPRIIRRTASAFGMAVLMAMGLGVAAANAQFSHDPIQNRDLAHAQQMNDYAIGAAYASWEAEEAYYEEDYDTGYYSDSSPPAPLTLEQQYLIQAQQRDQEIMDELRADPRFERYINGGWDYYQAREPAEPGEFCTATYLSRHGMISLTGHDQTWDGGMLLLIGAKIPRPEAVEQVTATLTQTGDAPATVKAYLFANNPLMEGLGTLGFAVPSMEDALNGMIDETEMVVHIDGQQVFRMSWKDGLKARDELRKCVRQR
jgi:hypothetical protein